MIHFSKGIYSFHGELWAVAKSVAEPSCYPRGHVDLYLHVY